MRDGRFQRTLLSALPPLAVTLVVVAGWALRGTMPASSGVEANPSSRQARTPPPQPGPTPARRSPAHVVDAPRAATLPPAASDASLAARIDRWARSPDPQDAMRAYRAVFDCLQARRDERRPAEVVAAERHAMENAVPADQREPLRRAWKTAAAQCADVRSDQVQDRLRWLARAAQAGVPMAAVDFIFEGPDGLGVLQDLDAPRTPPTDAWMAQRDAYVDTALRHCDMMLVGLLGTRARGDANDVGAALNFWQARAACNGANADRPPLADDAAATRALRTMILPPAPT